jgi:hypothetical protein
VRMCQQGHIGLPPRLFYLQQTILSSKYSLIYFESSVELVRSARPLRYVQAATPLLPNVYIYPILIPSVGCTPPQHDSNTPEDDKSWKQHKTTTTPLWLTSCSNELIKIMRMLKSLGVISKHGYKMQKSSTLSCWSFPKRIIG